MVLQSWFWFTNMHYSLASGFVTKEVLDDDAAKTDMTSKPHKARNLTLMLVHPTPMDSEHFRHLIRRHQRRRATANDSSTAAFGVPLHSVSSSTFTLTIETAHVKDFAVSD